MASFSVPILLWHVQIGNGSFERFRSHADRFRKRGMRMDSQTDVGGIGVHFDRERSFRDNVSCRRSDYAGPDDTLMFLVVANVSCARLPGHPDGRAPRQALWC